ncbi:hypothetical protein J6590_074047 [Homalodisca vitripennis]|nr:hypothetical protein J6590_074047 [Homalodisca vitripennis]
MPIDSLHAINHEQAKKASLTLNLRTNGLKVSSEPPSMSGQAGCLQGRVLIKAAAALDVACSEPRVVNLLRHYIEQFSLHSCIRWVPRTHERDYVVFTRGNWGSDRCFAMIGRLGGPQHVNISERCLHFYKQRPDVHNIPHEMLHALGFVHEHQRRDRRALQDYNNRIYTNFWTDITFPFDIHSVMQYRASSIFRSLFGETVGPLSEEMSMLDWMKLNYIYCRGPHICDTNYSLCANHKNILKQCIRRGALPLNLLHVQDSNWLNG